MAAEEAEAGVEMAMELAAYNQPLTVVSSFKYLGLVLSTSDNNWLSVIHNLRRAHQKWSRLSLVIG